MKHLLALAVPLVLGGCTSWHRPTLHLPYRIDIRQGNYVTQQMVAKLKPGQTKSQVRFILGTPLVTDIFHADRWDYIYRFQPGYGSVQERHLTVYFKDGKLSRLSGDIVAAKPGTGTAPAPENEARIIDIGPAKKPANKKPAAKAKEAK